MPAPVVEFAPAKINLSLHVTGKRADGYHLLDSLIAFADIGDELVIAPADDFSFSLTGPFAHGLSSHDNLVSRAAYKISERLGEKPNMHITLTKNLPIGAGIGGGSADAAATVRGVMKFFDLDAPVDDILCALGADVPACYHSAPMRIGGIGEQIELVTKFPATPALLVNPLIPCSTPAVFQALRNVAYRDKTASPDLPNKDALFRYLGNTRNDLTDAAISIVPEIAQVLDVLTKTHAPIIRMSGSGATCFALFDTDAACKKAADDVSAAHPDWWVHSGKFQPA